MESHQTDRTMFSKSYMTRIRIAVAMDKLCEEKPFKKIRIEDIVTESGVSRSNFYHNFEDKYAVVNWIADVCHEDGIFRIGRDLTWLEGHLITTREMDRFKRLFHSADIGADYESPVPHFVRMRQENLRETIVEYQHLPLTDELEFQLRGFPYCESRMSAMFRMGELPYGLERFCELLVGMTPAALHAALEQPALRVPSPMMRRAGLVEGLMEA